MILKATNTNMANAVPKKMDRRKLLMLDRVGETGPDSGYCSTKLYGGYGKICSVLLVMLVFSGTNVDDSDEESSFLRGGASAVAPPSFSTFIETRLITLGESGLAVTIGSTSSFTKGDRPSSLVIRVDRPSWSTFILTRLTTVEARFFDFFGCDSEDRFSLSALTALARLFGSLIRVKACFCLVSEASACLGISAAPCALPKSAETCRATRVDKLQHGHRDSMANNSLVVLCINEEKQWSDHFPV
jgi:hypothetical protein